MTRGLMDPVPVPEDDDSIEGVNEAIDDLYVGQNMLHDRLVRIEKELDHSKCKNCKNCKCKKSSQQENDTAEVEAADRKFWKKGL